MKAILVIDIPKKCYECPLMSDDMYCKAYANIVKGRKLCVEDNVMRGIKDIGCPLKPLPKKLTDVEYLIKYEEVIGHEDYIEQARGYNRCIDEIIGEQE